MKINPTIKYWSLLFFFWVFPHDFISKQKTIFILAIRIQYLSDCDRHRMVSLHYSQHWHKFISDPSFVNYDKLVEMYHLSTHTFKLRRIKAEKSFANQTLYIIFLLFQRTFLSDTIETFPCFNITLFPNYSFYASFKRYLYVH